MATQRIDFRASPLPDMTRGQQYGRGWLHVLRYQCGVNLLVDDVLEVYGKVPEDENWYALQWYVDDATSDIGTPNGWDGLALYGSPPTYRSPIFGLVPVGTPWTPTKTAGNLSGSWTQIYNRSCDGGPIYWEDFITCGVPRAGLFRVSALSELFAMPRWFRSMEFCLESHTANKASGGAKNFTLVLEVVRFPTPDEDFNRLKLLGEDFLARDVHMEALQPILAQ